MSDTSFQSRLEHESKRLCMRYVNEIVLPYNLCPWAAPALRNQTVELFVIQEELAPGETWDAALQKSLELLRRAAERPEQELILLLFPRCTLDRLSFDAYLRELRERLRPSTPPTASSSFALAAFHPDAPRDTGSPERLIPFLRRSPDPLIQAVQSSILERLETTRPSGTGFVSPSDVLALLSRAPDPEPLRLRIAKTNLATLERVGFERVEAELEAIHEDRARTYARLFQGADPLSR